MIAAWHIWVVLAILAIVVEMMSADLIVGSIGVGCLAAAVAAFGDGALSTQLIAFIGCTLAMMFAVRPTVKRWLYRGGDPRQTGADALVGQAGTVVDAVGGETVPGRVKVGGEEWRAVTQGAEPLPVGETVTIDRIDGATLIVRKSGRGDRVSG